MTTNNENRYLVIERFWNDETVDTLRGRISSILSGMDLTKHTSIFTTNDQARKSDDYFLESGREIRFFWEERAWDKETTPPKLLYVSVGMLYEWRAILSQKEMGYVQIDQYTVSHHK
mgnify:CR=1 FL=1